MMYFQIRLVFTLNISSRIYQCSTFISPAVFICDPDLGQEEHRDPTLHLTL
jgi:hypothetical protein